MSMSLFFFSQQTEHLLLQTSTATDPFLKVQNALPTQTGWYPGGHWALLAAKAVIRPVSQHPPKKQQGG